MSASQVVNPHLTLIGGEIQTLEHAGAYLGSPATPLVEQVIQALQAMPAVPDAHLDATALAQATVAVCLRWGSTFAWHARADLPAPKGRDGERPLTDAEFALLAAELCGGFKRWLTLRRDDPALHRQLSARALAHLPPMPVPATTRPALHSRFIPPGTDVIPHMRSGLYGFVFTASRDGGRALVEGIDSKDHQLAEAAREAAYRDPMGVLGEALTWFCWEREATKAHADLQPCTARPLERRYNQRQADAELRRIAKNLAALHPALEKLFEDRERSWGEKVVGMGLLVRGTS